MGYAAMFGTSLLLALEIIEGYEIGYCCKYMQARKSQMCLQRHGLHRDANT